MTNYVSRRDQRVSADDLRRFGDVNITVVVPPDADATPAATDDNGPHRSIAGGLNPDRQTIKVPAPPVHGSDARHADRSRKL